MPELPEAETIARGLRPVLSGRTIRFARVVRPDVVEGSPGRFRAQLRGRTIERLARRGKKVLIHLDGSHVLVVSLGMTGRLIHIPPGRRAPRDATHPAVRIVLLDGGSLLFDDTRRFGSLACLTADEWLLRSRQIGPEPLGLGYAADDLYQATTQSRSPIRSWLLDQRRVAGVGNIYALEALHRAKIHPGRPALSLSQVEATRLHRQLRTILEEAISARGTTLRDYRTATGASGTYVGQLGVYGREGQECSRCTATVERIVFGNRSAFFCPTCQPESNTPPLSDPTAGCETAAVRS